MPATPAKSETTSSIILNSRNPTKIRELRKALGYHNLLIHDSRANLKEHPPVKQAIDEILKGERGSVAKEGLWQNLESVRSRYEWANELTFLVHFILAVLGDVRSIKERLSEGMLQPDEIAYVMRSWDASGLYKGFSVTMKTGILPKVNTKDKALAALLAKFPRVKKPVPDVLFGLDETPFNDKETVVNDLFPEYTEVASGYRHAFGVIEAKDMTGDVEEAIVQACRGGAALVMSRMQFNYQAIPGKKMNRVKNPKAKKAKTAKGKAATEKAPSNSPQFDPGPDLQSFAFSITLTPKRAEIWVNWAEHREDQATLFHMNFLDEYRLSDEDGIKGFRVALFQIMDWGLVTRRIQIQEVIASINNKLNAGTQIERIEGEVEWDSDEDGGINVESEDDEVEPSRKRPRE